MYHNCFINDIENQKNLQEFDNLIKYCAQQFDTIPFCSNCGMSQCRRCDTNNCYNCLTHIHSIHTKDEHYTCKKITYNYILKHGYRYVSEMAEAFLEVKKFLDLTRLINIISVGCGPSTELYGAAAVFRSETFNYCGFDLSNIWESIQNFNVNNFSHLAHIIKYYNFDFIKYVNDNDKEWDILVLNYFLSDFIKYKPQDCDVFINNLVRLIQEGRFSTIIINDVMLLYDTGTGYACMEKIASLLSPNKNYSFNYQRRHFADPNQFQFKYGSKHSDNIWFTPIIPEAQSFNPFATCGSIQLIIKTMRKQQQ